MSRVKLIIKDEIGIMLRTIVIAMKQTETMSMGQITTDIQANIMSQREI